MRKNRHIQLKQLSTKSNRMTCIIGGKCIDGVVLVGDRKIKYNNNTVEYADKIFSEYYPVVTAGAGSNISYDKFRNDAKEAAQKATSKNKTTFDSTKVSGILQRYPFLDEDKAIFFGNYERQLEDIVRNTNSRYEDRVGEPFEILLATQLYSQHAVLRHIGIRGAADDIAYRKNKFKIIGGGEPFARVLLTPFWYDEIKMEDFARLAYFTIKYLDFFAIDDSVGLGGNKPQVWFIPDVGQIYNEKNRTGIIEKFEKDTNRTLEKFKLSGINALIPPDV